MDGKKSWFIQKFCYMWGRCLAPHNACPRTVLCFDKNLNFWKLAVKTWFRHWLSRLCIRGGLEVWLLNRCGPNLCFLKAFERSARFLQWKKWREVTLLSRQKLGITYLKWHGLWQSHRKRASRYMYTYIMHNASTQSRKVNAYIPRAWPKI